MSKKIFIILTVLILQSCQDKKKFEAPIAFEASEGKETSSYLEVIDFYRKAADFSNSFTLEEFGMTDQQKPLHLLKIKAKNSIKNPLKVLIINGIHPGESDGIDASMLLVKKIINKRFNLPKEVELYILPIYNVGGALNRNRFSRANQNGPEEYGFRGNALNYDLNRDFIKSDTQNSKAFYQIYHHVNPDVFIDTHVSNGADYQYTLTHLFTQSQRLGGNLGKYIDQEFKPKLEADLQSKNHDITPYVNVFNRTPKKGFTQFLDSPRYSTGYTSLFNSLGLMIETHMLKPYAERVNATLDMLESLIDLSAEEAEKIQLKRLQNFEHFTSLKNYPLNFKVDSTTYQTFPFLGFEASQEKSKVTGKNRLKYHTNQPVTYPVNYYNHYKPTSFVEIPKYYVVPKAYQDILHLFRLNNVEMKPITKDTIVNAQVYHISNFETRRTPYEGHYVHADTKVESSTQKITLNSDYVLVKTNQKAIRYIIETLEPEAVDSFFNWNFFDPILQQKEGFSPYVFEEAAAEILLNNPKLDAQFKLLKAEDEGFANNAYAQLEWIYKHSRFYEKAHNQYPIYRIL